MSEVYRVSYLDDTKKHLKSIEVNDIIALFNLCCLIDDLKRAFNVLDVEKNVNVIIIMRKNKLKPLFKYQYILKDRDVVYL